MFKCLKVKIIVCSEDEASDGLGRGADRGTRGPRWTLRQRLVLPGVLLKRRVKRIHYPLKVPFLKIDPNYTVHVLIICILNYWSIHSWMLSSVFRIHSRNVDLSRENWIFFRFEDPHQNEVDPKPWFSFWLFKNNCLTDRLMISRWVPGLGQGAAGSHGAHWRPPRPQRLRLTRGARFSRAWQVYGDWGTYYSGPLIERN